MPDQQQRGVPPAIVEDLVRAVCAEAIAAVREIDVPRALEDQVTRRAAELAD